MLYISSSQVIYVFIFFYLKNIFINFLLFTRCFNTKKMMKYEINGSALTVAVIIFIFLCFDVQLYHNIQTESRFNVTITVKAVMLDHVNTYFLQPLSELLVDVTQFPSLFPDITANHISYVGVIVAMISARLVYSDHLWIRRLAVIAFFVRQFLDDLDGLVARYRLGIDSKKQVSLPNTNGYLVDGVCDGLGFIIFWFVVFLYANKRQNLTQSNNYSLLQTTTQAIASTKTNNYYQRRLFKHYILILIQMGLSALFWNLFLIKYHHMVDPPINPGMESNRTPFQEEIFRSPVMFIIMWLWRFVNPHALTNYLLIAVWLNQQTQYAKRSGQYFFWVLFGIAFLSEIHCQDVQYRLELMTY